MLLLVESFLKIQNVFEINTSSFYLEVFYNSLSLLLFVGYSLFIFLIFQHGVERIITKENNHNLYWIFIMSVLMILLTLYTASNVGDTNIIENTSQISNRSWIQRHFTDLCSNESQLPSYSGKPSLYSAYEIMIYFGFFQIFLPLLLFAASPLSLKHQSQCDLFIGFICLLIQAAQLYPLVISTLILAMRGLPKSVNSIEEHNFSNFLLSLANNPQLRGLNRNFLSVRYIMPSCRYLIVVLKIDLRQKLNVSQYNEIKELFINKHTNSPFRRHTFIDHYASQIS
ncbi:MAG: hypothetical protein MHMPM18_002468 [Marteilia pararefringens]